MNVTRDGEIDAALYARKKLHWFYSFMVRIFACIWWTFFCSESESSERPENSSSVFMIWTVTVQSYSNEEVLFSVLKHFILESRNMQIAQLGVET